MLGRVLGRSAAASAAGHVQIIAFIIRRGGVLDGSHGLPSTRGRAGLRVGVLIFVADESRSERDSLSISKGELESTGRLGLADSVYRIRCGARRCKGKEKKEDAED